MLGDIHTIVTEMAKTSDYEDGWSKLELTVGPSQIITLSWPAWKLKICSFRVSSSDLLKLNRLEELALELETLDTLYESGETFIWKTNKNANEKKWDTMKRAKVVDVVDAFLEGVWTPPWKCGHCVARSAGKYVPRF
jgi:hypothetical protein